MEPCVFPIRELFRAIIAWRIWWLIAVDDVVGRYRRTTLGPAWLIVAQAAWLGGIYLVRNVWSKDTDPNYLWTLSISLCTWSLIVGIIGEAPMALVRSKGLIESYPLPFAIYLVRSIAGNFVTFGHLLVTYIAVSIFQAKFAGLELVQCIPAWAILIIFGLGVQMILAPLGARYRDIGPSVSSVLNLMFVLTPVFWIASPQQLNSLIVRFNPLFYLLEIGRQPFIGQWVPAEYWMISLFLALGTFCVGLITYSRTRPTIMYWL